MGVGPFPSFRRLAPLTAARMPPLGPLIAEAGQAVGRSVLAERERWALWLPAALAAGIAIYFALPFEPALSAGAGIGIAGVMVGIVATGSSELPVKALLSIVAAVAIGFSVAKLRTDFVAAPAIGHKIGPIGIDGRIVSAEAKAKGMRFVLSDLSIKRLTPDETPARVRISQRYGTELLVPGTWVHVTAVLMPPPEPAEPGGYDFGRWAWFQRLGAVGYAYGKPKAIAPLRADGWLEISAARLEGLRNRITARIRDVLPGNTGAISAALITGESGGIDPDDQVAFRDSGLVHVLSISGLHLALAGGIFFWIVRALLAAVPAIALTQPIKKWAAVAALCGAAFYLLISGNEAPATRSFIMLASMFTAILFDRPALSMRGVALAAALILLFAPESLIEPGFQMSFSAVIMLIAAAEWEQAWRMRHPNAEPQTWFKRARRYLSGIAVASVVAGLATAPFAIFHFDRASQYGLIANLAALPIVGAVIMPAAVCTMLAMPLGLERWPLLVMGKGVDAMNAIAHWVSGLPGATSAVAVWPMACVIATVAGGLWVALWRRNWRWLGAVPIAGAIVAAQFASPPDILISRDAKTVAVMARNGRLAFLGPFTDDYAAESWLRRAGDEREPLDAIGMPADGIRCDGDGCVARMKDGLLVALTKRPEGLAEDCAAADVVISIAPIRGPCAGPKLTIDRFDVSRNGAMAMWLSDPVTLETVQGERGDRPWSARVQRKRFGEGSD